MKRLDLKLKRILDGRYARDDFIIADAKDPDMSGGALSTGPRQGGAGFHTRREFLNQIRMVVEQDIVDIVLTSASNMEALNEQDVFRDSAVQPATRANDATDVWGGIRGATYDAQFSRPFRSASLARVMGPTAAGNAKARIDLGLYSVTFNNSVVDDLATLEAFAAFRHEAAQIGFRYFLEVFNPNAAAPIAREDVPLFVNDVILRSLAALTRAERPLFLKMPYNGPKALEELAGYDSSLIVGVLGGAAGTTRDTFELLHQAERHGARVALFGRKIRLAEAPLAIILLLREVASGRASTEQAVRAYHGELQKLGLRPFRPLDEDLAVTDPVLRSGTG